MALLPWIKNIFVGTEKNYIEKRMPQIISGKKFELSEAEKISTVYTCIDILSKTLAKLPLEVYKTIDGSKEKDKENTLYDLLHYNPNGFTTSFNFFSALETIRNLRGNAFAYIHRNKGGARPESLEIIKPDVVVDYKVHEGSLFYFLKLKPDEDELTPVPAMNILHFRMMTKDGIWGMNPIEALRLNLSATKKGMQTVDNHYDNDMKSSKAMKSTVSNANQKAMLEAIKKFKDEYAGFENAGHIIPLPPNVELQELKLNFADAQFIETIRFNADQIAGLFDIPGHRVGNTVHSKYNNVEQMNLGLKVDTISPIARMNRQEMEFKLLTTEQRKQGVSIEYNLKAMVEADYKTRIEGYDKLFRAGAISPNGIAKIENLRTSEEGDNHFVPMNMMTVKKAAANEQKNIKNGKKEDK